MSTFNRDIGSMPQDTMQESAPWRAPGYRERPGFLPTEPYEKPYSALAIELSRSAAALGKLAPVIDALTASLPGAPAIITALEQSLQHARTDNAYLSELAHKQRRIIETQTQEVAILSQKLSRLQELCTQQANHETGTSRPSRSGSSSNTEME